MITGQTIGREGAFTKSLRTKAENKPSFGENMGKIMLKINKCRLNNDVYNLQLTVYSLQQQKKGGKKASSGQKRQTRLKKRDIGPFELTKMLEMLEMLENARIARKKC